MNANLLIDAVVRQTMVLVGHLATSAGIRAPLAHVADQVFLDLVHELERQGVGRKVVADMFGLALRSYQVKVRRLSESATDRNRTLWAAVLEHVRARPGMRRTEILDHFHLDDAGQVGGVLHDLVESGLLYRTGRGGATQFRATSDEELLAGSDGDSAALEAYVWVCVYRGGPHDIAGLAERTQVDAPRLETALAALVADGRVERDADGRYRADTCVIPLGDQVGWPAAIFDHYQAMVTAICAKLRRGATRSSRADVEGGSTYSFDVWPGHPAEERVYGLLAQMRAQVSSLRAEVAAHNESQLHLQANTARVVFYLGQSVVVDDEVAKEVG